jgi:Dyp-type peroxidase family
MEPLEKHDIQGMVLKGYGKMTASRYVVLRIDDPARAKVWLARMSLEVSDGDHRARVTALNLAFGYHGLKALGLRYENLRQFAREFREGLTDLHRRRMLGDEGADSPDNWRWGGAAGDARIENVHILLMVFGTDAETMAAYWGQLEPVIRDHGLGVVADLDGYMSKNGRNPFGFNDGIAQPHISGNHPGTNPANTVAAGEFLLGYRNEYDVYPETPVIPAAGQQGDVGLLPSVGPAQKDLGRNGSYLVFRQMQTHGGKFWDYLRAHAADEKDAVLLGAKMFGRWPSGAPLALYPDADPAPGPDGVVSENDFGYHGHDRDGRRCPIGSHVRRSNPRDVFEDNPAAKSLSLTKKHRLIRRGRNYKTAVPEWRGEPAHEEEGIQFLCLNANIAGQFEFVQHTWANHPHFDRLYHDPDPIVGVVGNPPPGLEQDFTVQRCPVNRRLPGLPRFVTIRGGAYFFLPSITAIKYLATI